MPREDNDRLSVDRAGDRERDQSGQRDDSREPETRQAGPGRGAGLRSESPSDAAGSGSAEVARLKAALEAVLASLPDDVTPDLALMRKLQQSEARYRTLVGLLSNVVWVRDRHLDFVEPNPQWQHFTGQTFEEYRGRGWTNAIHPEDRAPVIAQIEETIQTQQPILRMRYRLWRAYQDGRPPSGEYRHCEVTAAPIRNDAGDVVEWIGMLQDRTEQHEAEAERIRQTEQLARSNRDLEDFAYIAAHDLKEPLRGIRLIASFLAEDAKEKLDEDGLRRLAQLHDLCARMQLLLDSLLESARAASVPLELTMAEVGGLVADATQLIGARIEEMGARINVTPEAQRTRVYCDPPRLAQVISNLIANGIKYNESLSKDIDIGLGPSTPDMVTLFVHDNGIGIAPEKQDHIFRMFRRLHPRECYGGGAGAGLSIVKKLVERHGGRIWVESAGPGRGSTFYFTLPAKPHK